MRRSSLRRKTPLKVDPEKARAFANKRSQLKRTQLRKRSPKREKFMREERAPMVRALVEAGVRCEIGPVLNRAGIPTQCQGHISGMHERRKRSAGGSLTNLRNLIPACSWCNGFIEDEPELVRERTGTTLVVREGDDEYESLGARND